MISGSPRAILLHELGGEIQQTLAGQSHLEHPPQQAARMKRTAGGAQFTPHASQARAVGHPLDELQVPLEITRPQAPQRLPQRPAAAAETLPQHKFLEGRRRQPEPLAAGFAKSFTARIRRLRLRPGTRALGHEVPISGFDPRSVPRYGYACHASTTSPPRRALWPAPLAQTRDACV